MFESSYQNIFEEYMALKLLEEIKKKDLWKKLSGIFLLATFYHYQVADR